METAITSVFAWEALDSRGTPTVGCEVGLRCGARGSVHVPSGASTGKHEARELRDGGERYGGQGVRRAVASVNDVLGPEALELDAADPESLDAALRALDGTESLERLGANAVLAVSLAATLAAADAAREPLYRYLLAEARPLLPLPMVNVISGGAHARGSGVDVQDFLVVPVGASTFAEAIEWCRLVRTTTEALAIARGHPASLVADEGGLGLPLASNRAGLELLLAGIERAGLAPGEEAAIAVDLAAGQLVAESGYRLSTEDLVLTADELIDELGDWCNDFPIVSLEDPLGEDDWAAWTAATARLQGIQVVGDDLFATQVARLERGIAGGVANAILLKPNQCGTFTGAREALLRARAAGYATVVSARSGDTEDAWLADLAVGWRAAQIKVGSTTRSERTAKWNRLLRIEAEAGAEAEFAGRQALAR
jgi:enolase